MKFFWRTGDVERVSATEMRRLFRSVFLTKDGLTVLKILLRQLCFFDACKTEGDRALNEYAKRFLKENLGLYADIFLSSELAIDETYRLLEGQEGEPHGR